MKAIAASEPYFDLGTYHRPIATSSPDAQTWFDRGLIWTFAFHHEEAVLCFRRALAHDDTCVMAYWGIAYALGANYNKPWGALGEAEVDGNLVQINQALEGVKPLLPTAEPVEAAMVNALVARLPTAAGDRDYASWERAYVSAMGDVYASYPDDLDIAAIYAEAMMNLTPWKLWDLRTGLPTPGSMGDEAAAVMERAMRAPKAMDHPGLLHFYIHLTELSPHPERAVPAADRLIGLVPDGGHLRHMPSHIDILIGDYRRAIASNELAMAAADKYAARQAGELGFYMMYRLHDITTLIYAAMHCGRYNAAMAAAGKQRLLAEAKMDGPMGNFVEPEFSSRIHVMVRFGRWDDILNEAIPADPTKWLIFTAFLRFARAIAYSARREVEQAEAERLLFLEAVDRISPERIIYPNKALDVMQVGVAMLDGELEYRKGNFDDAFDHLRTAIYRYDNLTYGEPWSWMQPVRHAYAALQLERGNVEEALKTYAADLGYDDSLPRAVQHPNNVWALHGYHECLVRSGREAEAKIVWPQLRLALATADVKVESSCFCRLDTTRDGQCCS